VRKQQKAMVLPQLDISCEIFPEFFSTQETNGFGHNPQPVGNKFSQKYQIHYGRSQLNR